MTSHSENLPVVLAITGASGAIYGCSLLEALLDAEIDVHLTISESGRTVIEHELGRAIDLDKFQLKHLIPDYAGGRGVTCHQYKDFMAPVASGSHRTRAMVVCPCSGSTLSGIASAAGRNLIERAADVHLKERRPLILVTRETPLSLIQIDNMRTVCAAGATVMPASPGFYHGYDSVDDLVNFLVARMLDHLGIEHRLMRRWGG